MSEYTRKPRASRRNKKSRATRTLLVVCMMLVVMVGSIAGTVAWLTDTTQEVKNTFTVGDINITLAETTGNAYHIVPGVDIAKNPKVTVEADSEACWLFVKITEENWDKVVATGDISYTVADGWTELEDGVYYRAVAASTANQPFDVLKDNKIVVTGNLTKTEAAELKEMSISLTFQAYAIQQEKFETAADAWEEISAPTVTE